MLIKRILLLALIAVISSCGNVSNDTVEEIIEIKFNSKAVSNYEGSHKILRQEFVVLDDINLGNVQTVAYIDDKIYAVDDNDYFAVYTNKGELIEQIGRVGRGPGEYLNVTSFDVDKEGNVFIYDGRSNILMKFGQNFEFIKSTPLEIEAETIKILNNGNILFLLAAWNEEPQTAGNQIAIADSSLNIIDAYIVDPTPIDDNATQTTLLTRTNGGIIYRKPFSNYFALISNEGKLVEVRKFDFGNANIPDDKLLNIDLNIWSTNHNYSYLNSTPIISDDNLFAVIKHGNNDKYTLYYNLKSGKAALCNKNEASLKNINFPITTSDEFKVISIISNFYEPDMGELPQYAMDGINEGMNVLGIYEL